MSSNTSYEGSKVLEVAVEPKSDKTLKNNMNSKNGTLRKRTSLVIVPQIPDDTNLDNDDNNEIHGSLQKISSSVKDSANDPNANKCKTNDSVQSTVLQHAKQKILHHSSNSKNSHSPVSINENAEHPKKPTTSKTRLTANTNDHSKSNRNSIVSIDSCMSRSSESTSARSSSSSISTSIAEASETSDEDVAVGNYRYLENDNTPDDAEDCYSKNSISSVSSFTGGYSLQEKLQNIMNDKSKSQNDTCGNPNGKGNDGKVKLIEKGSGDSVDTQLKEMPKCQELMSPQEVPFGRRYAGVSQFKPSARLPVPSSLTQTIIQTKNQLRPTNASLSSSTSTTKTSNNVNNFLNNTTKSRNQSNATILNQSASFCGFDSIKGSEIKVSNENATKSKLAGHMESSSNAVKRDDTKRFSENWITNDGNVNAGQKQHQLLEENENSCYDRKTPFDDDLQALLPNGNSQLRDDRSQSRTSLVSSSDGGILAEGETSSESSHSSKEFPQCDLGLSERLLLTHPVWFLPGIQRSGAVHFLQGKEEGNFIVRGSSQPNTMAVSVRLPPDTGPYIEHYLIQSVDGILCLESSRFKFDSIPALIGHYAQCCDELPVQLVLPRSLREAKNRQQLSSLALLGQEFWWYPMACPKSSETGEALLLDAKSPNSLTDTSGLGTTIFSNSVDSHETQAVAKVFSPTKNAIGGVFSQAGTPSDTTSSMSSFTTSGGGQHMQLMSPESIDSVILTMSPVDLNGQSSGFDCLSSRDMCNISGSLITFKSSDANNFSNKKNKTFLENNIRTQRPKPPNTLNLDFRKPPAPPLRWSKPLSPSNSISQEINSNSSQSNNFTVTTTVTFSMDTKNSPQLVEVTTPSTNNALCSVINSNTTFQTFAKRLSPEGECKDSTSLHGSSQSNRWQSHSSKDSNISQRKILSPCSNGTPTSVFESTSSTSSKSRKSKARKESKHYQESDILESPQVYCRSTLIDKISDYEDLWSHDPSDRTGLLSSFKPNKSAQEKHSDHAAETPTITSLNANLLSPANSSIVSTSPPNDNNELIATADSTSDTQQLLQFSANAQPRSRTGLILPGLMSHSASEDVLKSEITSDHALSTLQTPGQHSKQGSPFYAEPADALLQAGLTSTSILRRSQRGPPLSTNQRHSEPPKSGLIKTSTFPLIEPTESTKVAGSLDELKKKQQSNKKGLGRMEHWQLDSSWEFMVKNDCDDDNASNEEKMHGSSYGDYDSEEQWKPQNKFDKENSLGRNCQNNKKKPITVHQIISERLPGLNLPEFTKCTMLFKTEDVINNSKEINEMSKIQKVYDNQGGNRLSAYDNVERNFSFCQTYFNNTDSAPSDDGTVFSEPWDSSQWDSLIPNDDTTITSDTIHLSKCRPIVSEDDTIIEELSSKENNQDTLKPKKHNGSKQKIATILRNPSIKDREILCHPRNKINPYGTAGPGDRVRSYTLQLAQDQSSTFSRNIENFISCTKESREAAPQVVMRNMRQFMNGMKNYLVKHGEGKFQEEVESARSRLKSDEFLNLDAILETVMHQLVVLPLREHLYRMFVEYYTRSEDIQLLVANIKYACDRSPSDFGIRSSVTPPSTTSLLVISNLLLRLQEAETPLDKLELFMCVISTIFDATRCPRDQQLGADDFLPILVYVVAKCEFVCAEIEAEFMWGLLQPTLLNGEPGYYLTALCSAVHVLKTFMMSGTENGKGSLDWRSSSTPTCSSVLRVIIPDECNGSLQTRTLPVRPHTTTREVCRIIAHKARITNPQDYALFKVIDGEETPLTDGECPQDVRLTAKGKHCMLAYKRLDAKIAWPTAI